MKKLERLINEFQLDKDLFLSNEEIIQRQNEYRKTQRTNLTVVALFVSFLAGMCFGSAGEKGRQKELQSLKTDSEHNVTDVVIPNQKETVNHSLKDTIKLIPH